MKDVAASWATSQMRLGASTIVGAIKAPNAGMAIMFKSIKLFVIAAAMAVFSITTQSTSETRAATIMWTVNDATFADGGTVTGYFLWDTDLDQVDAWEFSVSGGDTSTFPAYTYSSALAGHEALEFTGLGNNTLVFNDENAPPRSMRFGFNSLSDLDTPIADLALASTLSAGSTGYLECFNCGIVRFGSTEAFFSAAVVPLPAALPLLLSALGVFGILGWRRRQTATA